MTAFVTDIQQDREQVRSVLQAAGPRGASHEDFVEAGLARCYVAALTELVGDEGLHIRTDFTTGTVRWSLEPQSLAA